MIESLRLNFEAVNNNKLFEVSVVVVILISALIVGVDSYHFPESSKVVKLTIFISFFISCFYVFELFVRILSKKNKLEFFKNFWNFFDFIIIFISLIPIDLLELALLGRIVRIFRVLRIVVIIPELKILLGSIFKSLPQIGFVALLMFIIFYIYAAVGTSVFSSVNSELWGNISVSMLTLFRIMTFEDWTDVMYETMSDPNGSQFSWIYYLSFIFFTAFAFLNMVIGIIVNVMEEERELLYVQEHPENLTINDLSNEISDLKKEICETKLMISSLVHSR